MRCKRKNKKKKTYLKLHFVWTMNDERCRWCGNFSIGTKANWNISLNNFPLNLSTLIFFFLNCFRCASYTCRMLPTFKNILDLMFWWACVRELQWFSPFSTAWELKIRFACVDNNTKNNFSNKIWVHKRCFYFGWDGVSLLLPLVTKILTFFYVRISFNRKVFGVDMNFHRRCFSFFFLLLILIFFNFLHECNRLKADGS